MRSAQGSRLDVRAFACQRSQQLCHSGGVDALAEVVVFLDAFEGIGTACVVAERFVPRMAILIDSTALAEASVRAVWNRIADAKVGWRDDVTLVPWAAAGLLLGLGAPWLAI